MGTLGFRKICWKEGWKGSGVLNWRWNSGFGRGFEEKGGDEWIGCLF